MYKNYKAGFALHLTDLYCCTYLPSNTGFDCVHKYTRGLNITQWTETQTGENENVNGQILAGCTLYTCKIKKETKKRFNN